MKHSFLTQRKWSYTAMAFLFPFLGMLLVMLFSGYTPFGNSSMLYSDMYHQYYPFFVAFRKALRSGDSLLYSWNVGMGMDYLGLISYYLASPLNLLSVIVPEGWLLSYFSLLVPIKLGLAGLFFGIFLKKLFNKDDFSIPLFGCFYGMCAWALGYQWNVMWLDTFALLPLVVLGMVALLKERKFVLYTTSLFLSIFANYYIGLFTCIFIFLLFFCYEICRWQGFKKFIYDLSRIAFFSILAIGMTALLELPALAALQTTQSSVNTFPEGFRLNIADENTWKGLLDAMRQVAGNMNGGLEPNFKEGLPNLYCGVITNILAILFLTAKQVKIRDKICSVLLLVFFQISFIIRQLDYIWHGFHFTNMIPYRFSFLHSFVMLYMAYRAFLLRNRFQLWQILFAAFISIGIVACSNNLTEPVYLAYNGVFLVLYLAVLIYQQSFKAQQQGEERESFMFRLRQRRKNASCILCLMIAAELILNGVSFGLYFTGTGISNYPKGTESSAAVIRHMKEREADTLFYRTEATHSQTLNDGAINGYNGISTFTSSANVRITEFMKALGYGAKNTYNRYCFEESSPVANLFLNLKYMLERDGKVMNNPYFTNVLAIENVHLLENNAYLPLGFLSNAQLVNVDFSKKTNPFLFQNELLSAATGIKEGVWTLLPATSLTVNNASDGSSVSHSNGQFSYDNTELAENNVITYSYTVGQEGFLCFQVDQSKRNNFSVLKNGIELYSESYSLPQMLAASQVTSGDVIEIKFTTKKDEKGNITVSAAILNEELFRQNVDILSASTLQLTEFRNTYVEGTIDCNRSGVLYTSIPQNANSWSATVDGKPAEIVLIGDAMIGLLLPEGAHTVTFTYHNSAFALGWKISLCCFLIFVGLYLVLYKKIKKRKKGKYER